MFKISVVLNTHCHRAQTYLMAKQYYLKIVTFYLP